MCLSNRSSSPSHCLSLLSWPSLGEKIFSVFVILTFLGWGNMFFNFCHLDLIFGWEDFFLHLLSSWPSLWVRRDGMKLYETIICDFQLINWKSVQSGFLCLIRFSFIVSCPDATLKEGIYHALFNKCPKIISKPDNWKLDK